MPNTILSDIIIIGGGLYGCSTAYNLAKYGAKNIVVLERGAICSGGTAKSCAIVRTHYSIEANMHHAVESLKIFANFQKAVGGDCSWRQTGYLILGPEEHRQPMEIVFRRQNSYGVDTQTLTPAETRAIHPLLNVDDVGVIGYDTLTGYCDPYLTTTSYAQRARALGARIYTDAEVTAIQMQGDLKRIETNQGVFESETIISTIGPWTHRLGAMIGVELPFEISRHKVITLKIKQPYRLDWPIVKDLTTPDKLYFRPETGGVVLIGTGDHGDPITDADSLTDTVDTAHIARIHELIAARMPAFVEADYTAGWTGPYDITPDWNPIVGQITGVPGVYVTVGFSGHGFKLAPTISEALAQVVLGLEPRVSIDCYDMSRFEAGEALYGVYGIGSIS